MVIYLEWNYMPDEITETKIIKRKFRFYQSEEDIINNNFQVELIEEHHEKEDSLHSTSDLG